MAIHSYKPHKDEIQLELIWQEIEEIDEQILNLERGRKKLMDQVYFLQDDLTRKGRDYV
jgi:hypothetical protein